MDIGVELSLDYAKLSAERLLEAKEQSTCHSGKILRHVLKLRDGIFYFA